MKYVLLFALLFFFAIGCNKPSETPQPHLLSYTDALDSMGMKPNTYYPYMMGSVPSTVVGNVSFNSDTSISEIVLNWYTNALDTMNYKCIFISSIDINKQSILFKMQTTSFYQNMIVDSAVSLSHGSANIGNFGKMLGIFNGMMVIENQAHEVRGVQYSTDLRFAGLALPSHIYIQAP